MIALQRPNPKEGLPPLQNGDHLDQATFHERYEAMPGVRAELIEGIVYMSSPQKLRHGRLQRMLVRLVDDYVQATPGTDGCVNTTSILAANAEPQPDSSLLVLPEYGGQTTINERGYLCGAPEWIGEISDATESIDLHGKKRDYEKAGVSEYMVAAVRTGEVFWFNNRRGTFKRFAPSRDGVIRSAVFPGFWFDPRAFLEEDSPRLLSVLREGLAAPEHAAFVARLAQRKKRRR